MATMVILASIKTKGSILVGQVPQKSPSTLGPTIKQA